MFIVRRERATGVQREEGRQGILDAACILSMYLMKVGQFQRAETVLNGQPAAA
jgi:hypothetical protein